MTYAADSCDLKKRKQRTRTRHISSPWFDKECAELKNNVKELGNKVQREPYDAESREKLYFLKRKYRLKVKEKTLADLESTGKNSKYFWKIIKKLDAKQNENIFKKGIPGSSWKKHFESLGTPDMQFELPSTPSENGPLDYNITMTELDSASYILRPYKLWVG